MQVGAFYEVYGYSDTKQEYSGSNINEFAKYCELAISKKNVCVGKYNIVMSGFRDYMLDKYLKKLQQMNYTTAVYSQDEKAAGTTRSLTGIYSPGTFFTDDNIINNANITNNTMCIWLQKIKTTLICGISNIDIYTGKSIMFEYNQLYSNTPDIFDELEKYISIYKPSEIIIIHNLTQNIIDNIISYSDIETNCMHIHDIANKKQSILNCEKQIYQQEILKRFFSNIENLSLSNENFMNFPIATQSYCFLLDFIYQHNPNLIKSINLPIFDNKSDRLILANHSLKQLNMIETNYNVIGNKHSSVCNFLNSCVTVMGKRLFNYTLLNPITDANKLNNTYEIQDYLLNQQGIEIETLRKMLTNIKDIEKMERKLQLKKITPSDFYYLQNNLIHVKQIFNIIKNDKYLYTYLCDSSDNVLEYSDEIHNIITNIFSIEECINITNLDFEINFIKKDYDKNHDNKVEIWMDSSQKLESIRKFLNDKVKLYEKNKKTTEYVKIHSTDKSGHSLITTKRRSTILNTQLKNIEGKIKMEYFSTFNNSIKNMELTLDNIKYNDAYASNVSICNSDINGICKEILQSKIIMINSLQHIYKKFINDFVKLSCKISIIVKFIGNVDLLFTQGYIARKYNYCKPSIDNTKTKSFISVEGLRHPLIEQLLQSELYVTNDIKLNAEDLGVLLYGTNAVGKSSLIKALGISVILAQSGFYVPCSSFTYKPYEHIFTRILGNDNLFKGLSSFAVEMIEFKNILSCANENSLILGDELCSGTESNSAISIFVAGLEFLYEKKSNFIFATHFHEIVNFGEIKSKEGIKLKHMIVLYDKENDKLLYDRKLHDGPGESMYGLEVCKSLHLPDKFLKSAHAIRNKYCKMNSSILEYKSSRYNSKKLKGICEECKKEFSTEIHHIHHQKNANKDGFIGHFHKNHVANLKALCEECHLKIHHPSTITFS